MVVRVVPTEAEQDAGTFSSETLHEASRCIRTDGALVLEKIFDPTLLLEAKESFSQKYECYLDGQKHDNATEVGERRLMITVDLEAPFDRRELLANSWLFSILRNAFEGDFVLDAFGVVCSLPAAPRQHVHSDTGVLFPQAALNRLLPIYAITVAIPLIEMNETHGTTALWLGSHRDEAREADALREEEGEEPLVQEGSCMLWDYRLQHGGTANQSSVPRPLLYMTYCRPWFTDRKNYQKIVALQAPKDSRTEYPEDLRALLARVKEY
jgi:hypothetical protein